MDTNKTSLHIAIEKLPIYQPKEQVWLDIEHYLDQSKALDIAVESLPIYEPPSDVWDTIEQELLRVRRIPLWKNNIFRIAASIAILIVASIFIIQSSNATKIEIVKTTTIAENPSLLIADWNNEEADFKRVELWCKQHSFIDEQQKIQALKAEIQALTAAKATVEKAMAQYGQQARFIHQIKKIERARSETLKAIVKEI